MKALNLVVLDRGDSIDDIISNYDEINKRLKDLEKLKSHLSKSIKSYFTCNNLSEHISSKYKVSLNEVTRRTLSKELLIEMGIDDETLELCTKETKYNQLVIR